MAGFLQEAGASAPMSARNVEDTVQEQGLLSAVGMALLMVHSHSVEMRPARKEVRALEAGRCFIGAWEGNLNLASVS